jgi:hypothetical protein
MFSRGFNIIYFYRQSDAISPAGLYGRSFFIGNAQS